MDRNPPGTGAVLATKPNGRKENAQPFGSRRLPKKGAGNSESKENSTASDTDKGARSIPRPIRSSIHGHRQTESLVENRFTSPSPSIKLDRSATSIGTPSQSRNTRIPRPTSSNFGNESHRRAVSTYLDRSPDNTSDLSSPMRQPMDLKAAFRRAQEQTAAEADSDADNTVDLQQAFDMANAEFDGLQGIDGSPSPAPRSLRRNSRTAIPRSIGATGSGDLNRHLQRFDRNHQLTGIESALDGLFTRSRAAPPSQEAGHPLEKKTSNSWLNNNREHQIPEVEPISARNQRMPEDYGTSVQGPPVGADVPVPSIEYESASDDPHSPDFDPPELSPEKSMNWQLDADFTAGDLQVSQSPRILTGKQNIQSVQTVDESAASRRSNDKLTQIQQREHEAARTRFPEESAVKQMNRKLEEVRARELEASSRRALAASRLDEIRMRNSEPRSESPEVLKDAVEPPLEKISVKPEIGRQRSLNPKLDLDLRGEPIRDTPVMVFRKASDGILADEGRDGAQDNNGQRRPLPRYDSHDLLRRLARATSSSPIPDQQSAEKDKVAPVTERTNIKPLSDTRNLNHPPLPREERGRLRNLEIKNPRDRPTVGFADLIRTNSDDSAAEKRRSTSTSEADPTDRIAAELNLFAPLDNYSEKGSIRAPSPVAPEPADEKTPRPIKVDPLTQPTPRVIGAYVETPATVRVKEEGGCVRSESTSATQNQAINSSPSKRTSNPAVTGRARASKRAGTRSSSLPTTSRRARSSSRRRRPPINTAKPPTVKDDIIAILRANNIDDSTLENLDSILADHEIDDLELKQMVNDSDIKIEDDLDVKISQASGRNPELEVFDRMSKSLQTGLMGIRSAKKGIERLEDKVTHKRTTKDKPDIKDEPDAGPLPQPSVLPQSSVSRDGAASVLITMPKLYHKEPRFRLTTFGIVTICALLWYVLECTFSSLYGGPDYVCTPTIPCDWSRNEPYFPYTMPFMLDEWTTGGKGRALAFKVGDEVGDLLADVSDWVTNTDFTQFDERYMDSWQRKRHRRRLRKHGLVPKWKEPAGYQARYADWQIAKAAREWAQELGLEEDETMGADEIVR